MATVYFFIHFDRFFNRLKDSIIFLTIFEILLVISGYNETQVVRTLRTFNKNKT